ncbi:MAG: metal ABC transporter permease [Parachlamydiales bacterium]|nr:metal ABC transporter permease [Parachlamydiales bacterium]
MSELLIGFKTSTFLHLAIIGAIIASFSSGLMGSYVVIKRISSITGSIAHSILGGIGFFEFLKYKYEIIWLDTFYGAFLAGIISAILIGITHLYFKQKEDAVIATIWSTGMAIGIIFLTLVPGMNASCTHFLFGDIFSTTKLDVVLLGCLASVVIFLTIIFYRKFLLICFDESLAYLQKVNIKALYFLLLIMISISIVLIVKIIGIILVIALITIPATIANQFTTKLSSMMVVAILLSIIFNIVGITFSYALSMPPGATIAIVVAFFYTISFIFKKFYIYD